MFEAHQLPLTLHVWKVFLGGGGSSIVNSSHYRPKNEILRECLGLTAPQSRK